MFSSKNLTSLLLKKETYLAWGCVNNQDIFIFGWPIALRAIHTKLLQGILFRCLKTSQYLVWPQFASRGATHLLCIELIRLLIVACGMGVHSSSMAVWRCWILAGIGTWCRIRWSRASQTCSMGDMSGEYADHVRTGLFSASRNFV